MKSDSPGLIRPKSMYAVLSLLLLSLPFRMWSFTDEFEIRGFSSVTEFVRAWGFVISGSMLVLTICVSFVYLPKERPGLFFVPALLLLIVSWITRLKFIYGQETSNLLESAVLSLFILILFGLLIPALVYSRSLSISAIIAAIFTSGVIWLFASLIEWQQNPASVIWYDRFHGISGHPNHAGVISGVSAIAGLGVFFLAKGYIARWGILLLLALLSSITVWSGSRTALLVQFSGFTCILLGWRRSLTMISSVCVLAIAVIVMDSQVEFSRFEDVRAISAANTRIAVWEKMWLQFQENPLLGGDRETSSSESSLLLVLSTTGIVGGSVFVLAMSLLLYQGISLLRVGVNSEYKMQYKSCGAVIVAIFVGSIFEGNLRAEFSFPVFVVYLLSSSAAGVRVRQSAGPPSAFRLR